MHGWSPEKPSRWSDDTRGIAPREPLGAQALCRIVQLRPDRQAHGRPGDGRGAGAVAPIPAQRGSVMLLRMVAKCGFASSALSSQVAQDIVVRPFGVSNITR